MAADPVVHEPAERRRRPLLRSLPTVEDVRAGILAECEHKRVRQPPCRVCEPDVWRLWCELDVLDEGNERGSQTLFVLPLDDA